jgi:hypothetical protein
MFSLCIKCRLQQSSSIAGGDKFQLQPSIRLLHICHSPAKQRISFVIVGESFFSHS